MDNSNQAPQQPQATPPTNPTNPTPPQAPLDANGNPLPPLTIGQKVKYGIIALIFIAIVGGLIAWSVTSSNKETEKTNDLKTTGLKVTGTANGDVHEYTDRSRRGGTSIRYKAIYDYSYANPDRDGRIDESTAIGEKIYDTKEEVEAFKGQTVDIYYDPNDPGKGEYVENEK